jgi:hypothetical protein
MTYIGLLQADNERANKSQDGPVRKTGLRALHDAAKKRLGL